MTETTAQPNVLASLGINGSLFLAQLINFAIILFVVWKFVYKPLLKLMDERSSKIAKGLSNAEEAEVVLQTSRQEVKGIIRDAEQEARGIMEKTTQQAEAEKKRMMEETRVELERQLVEARERLRVEKEATFQAVKGEIGALVMAAVKKVTDEAVDAKGKEKLFEKAVEGIEKAS